ncbi:MAG TPA: TetR family transcriptional regulator [Chloroflexia bacterium]|nr:TetR family transcriptional regulator [Chloroflexia bacterium]
MATTTAQVAQPNASDPRVKRTRQLLLKAFTDLAQEKGISAISVQDIAERATVNRATFYAHFEDKYALMSSWIREEFQQVLARKIPASATLSVHNLRVLILSVFDFLATFYGSCKRSDTQFEPMFETTMQQELCDVFLGWLKQGASPTIQGEKLETTAQIVSWAIFGPAVQWSRGARIRSSEEMSRDVLAIVLASLSGVVGPIS